MRKVFIETFLGRSTLFDELRWNVHRLECPEEQELTESYVRSFSRTIREHSDGLVLRHGSPLTNSAAEHLARCAAFRVRSVRRSQQILESTQRVAMFHWKKVVFSNAQNPYQCSVPGVAMIVFPSERRDYDALHGLTTDSPMRTQFLQTDRLRYVCADALEDIDEKVTDRPFATLIRVERETPQVFSLRRYKAQYPLFGYEVYDPERYDDNEQRLSFELKEG